MISEITGRPAADLLRAPPGPPGLECWGCGSPRPPWDRPGARGWASIVQPDPGGYRLVVAALCPACRLR